MEELKIVGKSLPRVDAFEKVTGRAKYSPDLELPGMLYGKVLRSPYSHARIKSLDTSRAAKLPYVKAIITGEDVPEQRSGLVKDRHLIAKSIVRFAGEPVAAVAADSLEAAEEALDLIDVEYEELPAIYDAEEAMKSNPAVIVHPDLFQYGMIPQPYPLYRFDPDRPNVYLFRTIRKGDVERGFADSHLVMENRFSAPMVQHCALEPHTALARPEADGGLTVWMSTHTLYAQKMGLCALTRLPPSKVRVITPYLGGCFGGKGGALGILSGIATLLALKAGRPVRAELSREEVSVDGGPRHPMVVYVKDGVKADGTLLAREMRLILDAGAYSGIAVLIAKNAAYGAVGSYRIPNFKLDSYAVATNNPPKGPMRGFGSTEVIWAIESQMDMLAERLGIAPVELRKKNILKEGEEDVCGMITHSIGAQVCLDKTAARIGLDEKPPAQEGVWKRGKGIALCNKYTMPATTSVVSIKVHQDGAIEVRHSAHEAGQGCNTILAQIAAEEFGTSMDRIRLVCTDTALTPYDHATVSSRTTFHTGNALRLACKEAKQKIYQVAAQNLGVAPEKLELKDGVVYVKGEDRSLSIAQLLTPLGYLPEGGELVAFGTFNGPREPEDLETGQGKRVVTYYAHGANAVEVMVNVETGEVKVIRAAADFDMGQPINPKLVEGQIEGGLGMGIGAALYEQAVLEEGVVINPNFVDYKMPTTLDVPAGEAVTSMIDAVPHREGPYMAKGFCEGASVAVPPAIANAIFDATGVRITDLPITKEKVLRALKGLKG